MKPIFFASGPSKKFENWDSSMFDNHCLLNRTHIYDARDAIKANLDQMREILSVPDDYALFFTPGSGSGAIFCAFLNLLESSRKIYVYQSGFFSSEWEKDLKNQFKLNTINVAFDDAFQTVTESDADKMVVNVDTTNGKRHANYDFLPEAKNVSGIAILDAVCSAFIEEIPWNKFDAVAFSVQKVLGGDGSLGVLALSKKAVARIGIEKPWPIGRLFNINRWTLEEICNGRTMSTPSILAMIELRAILDWVKNIGGFKGLQKQLDENWQIIDSFMKKNPMFTYLEKNATNRGRGVVCLELSKWNEQNYSHEEKMNVIKKISQMAQEENVYDIANFANASWRFWVGPTQTADDIEIGLNRFANLF